MWTVICYVLLAVECFVLACVILGRIQKKQFHQSFLFLAVSFCINLTLNFIPYFYRLIEQKAESNYALDILDCFTNAFQLFVGISNTESVTKIARDIPVFTYVFLLGALLALWATVSATIEAFGRSLQNSFRLRRAMKQSNCDVVLGHGEKSRVFAKGSRQTVLLVPEDIERPIYVSLMEQGFVVLRRNLTVSLLNSSLFHPQTRYNIICPKESCADTTCLDTYLSYRNQEKGKKEIYLYMEMEEQRAETIRREVIEKSGHQEWISTFCSSELMARHFQQNYPFSSLIPEKYLAEDRSLGEEVQLQYFFLGFGRLSQEIYRQSVLNDQFVSYKAGSYCLHPVSYTVFDTQWTHDDWNMEGLEHALSALTEHPELYYPLPELPYKTQTIREAPHYRDTLTRITKKIQQINTVNCIVIDTGDTFCNVDTGARLCTLLKGWDNFHIYVRSSMEYTEDARQITYYGRLDKVYTHDVIVNDSFSTLAKALHRVYTRQQYVKQANEPNFEEMLTQKATEIWEGMNYFTLYSNLYAAMNLRTKLHLLGLDYVADGKGEGLEHFQKCYPMQEDVSCLTDYAKPTVRNALLAQEHARWNAYHLLSEYLPLERSSVEAEQEEVTKSLRFTTKDTAGKKHACLTTYAGLTDLSNDLAAKASALTGKTVAAEEYDYYQYDDMLLKAVPQLLKELGYSLVRR